MRVKPFWVILLTIVVIWIGNYVYAEKQKLAHPVFLNHYLDLYLEDAQYIPFYFITNKEDTSFIQLVELGNIQGMPDRYGEHNGVEEVEQFGRYSLKRVHIQFDPETFEPPVELTRFDKMAVYFSENNTTMYPIGEIVLRPLKEESDPFSFKSGSVGEYSETRLKVKENLAIDSVRTVFDKTLQDEFFIKLQSAKHTDTVQSEDVLGDETWNKAKGTDRRELEFPVHMKTGDWLTVKSYAGSYLPAILDVKIELHGTTENGGPFMGQTGHLQTYPYMTKQSIQQVIDKRTEAEANE